MPENQGSTEVPLSVWLGGGQHGAEPAHRRSIAVAVIEAYSQPGDVVIDLLGCDGEAVTAATSLGRSVVTAAVVSDGTRLGAFDGLADIADLVLAIPGDPATAQPPDSALHSAAARLLRPGGMFVTLPFNATYRSDEPLSGAVASATEAGLDYFQHVVVLDGSVGPACSGDVSVPEVAHVDLLAFRRGR